MSTDMWRADEIGTRRTNDEPAKTLILSTIQRDVVSQLQNEMDSFQTTMKIFEEKVEEVDLSCQKAQSQTTQCLRSVAKVDRRLSDFEQHADAEIADCRDRLASTDQKADDAVSAAFMENKAAIVRMRDMQEAQQLLREDINKILTNLTVKQDSLLSEIMEIKQVIKSEVSKMLNKDDLYLEIEALMQHLQDTIQVGFAKFQTTGQTRHRGSHKKPSSLMRTCSLSAPESVESMLERTEILTGTLENDSSQSQVPINHYCERSVTEDRIIENIPREVEGNFFSKSTLLYQWMTSFVRRVSHDEQSASGKEGESFPENQQESPNGSKLVTVGRGLHSLKHHFFDKALSPVSGITLALTWKPTWNLLLYLCMLLVTSAIAFLLGSIWQSSKYDYLYGKFSAPNSRIRHDFRRRR